MKYFIAIIVSVAALSACQPSPLANPVVVAHKSAQGKPVTRLPTPVVTATMETEETHKEIVGVTMETESVVVTRTPAPVVVATMETESVVVTRTPAPVVVTTMETESVEVTRTPAPVVVTTMETESVVVTRTQPPARLLECPRLTDKNLFDAFYNMAGAGPNDDQIDDGAGHLWNIHSFFVGLGGAAPTNAQVGQGAAFNFYVLETSSGRVVPTPMVLDNIANPTGHAESLTAANSSAGGHFHSLVAPDLSQNPKACRYATDVPHNGLNFHLDLILSLS